MLYGAGAKLWLIVLICRNISRRRCVGCRHQALWGRNAAQPPAASLARRPTRQNWILSFWTMFRPLHRGRKMFFGPVFRSYKAKVSFDLPVLICSICAHWCWTFCRCRPVRYHVPLGTIRLNGWHFASGKRSTAHILALCFKAREAGTIKPKIVPGIAQWLSGVFHLHTYTQKKNAISDGGRGACWYLNNHVCIATPAHTLEHYTCEERWCLNLLHMGCRMYSAESWLAVICQWSLLFSQQRMYSSVASNITLPPGWLLLYFECGRCRHYKSLW